jgi:hypothetical protein
MEWWKNVLVIMKVVLVALLAVPAVVVIIKKAVALAVAVGEKGSSHIRISSQSTSSDIGSIECSLSFGGKILNKENM